MAGLTRKFTRDERGVSDVLAMAFMFLLAIFAGVLLHAYRSGAITSATDRQLQMKAEYFYKTAELAQVENYSLSYFESVAENLIEVTEPVVPGNYLHERIDNLLAYLCPPNYAVMVELTYENVENASWKQLYPSDIGGPGPAATQFTFSGKVTLIIAEAGENRVAQVDATLTLFRS